MKVFIQRSSSKQLKICPQSDGSVMVIAPKFLSQKQIASHIAENIGWISTRLKGVGQADSSQQVSLLQSRSCGDVCSFDNQVVRDIFCGKSILLSGQLYVCCPSVSTQTQLKDDCLNIFERQFASKEGRLKAITSFLKRMAASVLAQEVSKVGSIVALCPTKIQFKDLHGLWCSCRDAELRAIVLDYRVIQLPQNLQNYVIAHAFAHFVKQGHGEEFFACLSSYLPSYKQLQKQIEQYNFLLDV